MVMEQLKIIGLYGKKDRCGEIEGMQSLNNKKFYIFRYDPKIGDFVGEWITRHAFLDSINMPESVQNNESKDEPEI